MTTKSIFYISILFLLLSSLLSIHSEEKKVAVFEPVGGVDSSIKAIVREEISSVIVNIGGFTVLERKLINTVLEENKFQMGGLVDDSQISEIGKRMGANYACITTISKIGDNYYVSSKLIEVLTARIEKQKTGQTVNGIEDILDITQSVVKTMFEIPVPEQKKTMQSQKGFWNLTQPPYPGRVPEQKKTIQSQKENIQQKGSKTIQEKNENLIQMVTKNSEQETTTLPQSNREIISNIQSMWFDDMEMIYIATTGRKGYYIGKYEVTQAQWSKIMKKNKATYKNPSNPVESTSLNDILAFIKELNKRTGRKYRLPTEDEWLYAATGGSQRDSYQYSGSDDIDRVAWYVQNAEKRTHAVGMKRPNSLGLFDMTGNVWEWCRDSIGKRYTLRGGSWNNKEKQCLLTSRLDGGSKKEYPHVGFRLVLDL